MNGTVIKVGGSLLGGAGDLQEVAAAIARRRRGGASMAVVASALGGVTDALERAARSALDPGLPPLDDALDALRGRHLDAAHVLGGGVRGELVSTLDAVARQLEAIRARGELTEDAYARLLASGERLSVPLVASALRAAGVDARAMTAEEAGLRARGPRRAGSCDLAASRGALRRALADCGPRLMVLTGFYGLDRRGQVALFGRGGSDDTACALAAAWEARRLELWKDVPGVMHADPASVAATGTVPELSFDEAATLGDLGSGLVHRGCLEPLRRRPVEIVIRSPGGAAGAGTRLCQARRPAVPRVVALASRPARLVCRLRRGPSAPRRALTVPLLTALDAAGLRSLVPVAGHDALRFVVTIATDAEQRRAFEVLGAPAWRAVEKRLLPPFVGAIGDGVGGDDATRAAIRARLTAACRHGVAAIRSRGHAGLHCALHHDDLDTALDALHRHYFTACERDRAATAASAGSPVLRSAAPAG